MVREVAGEIAKAGERLLKAIRGHEENPGSSGALWSADAAWDDLDELDERLEAVTANRDALASQLDQYRAWLVGEFARLDELRVDRQLNGFESLASSAGDRAMVAKSALERLDEITGKGAEGA